MFLSSHRGEGAVVEVYEGVACPKGCLGLHELYMIEKMMYIGLGE